MAQYTVNFSCGHTETVNLYGKNDERHRKIEQWGKYGQCEACRKQDQLDRAERLAAEFGIDLPGLTGSEKQISWAQTLRAARLLSLKVSLDNQVEQIRTRLVHQQAPADKAQSTLAKCAEETQQVISWVARQTEAIWWIDRCERGDNEFLAEASKALPPTG